MAGAARTEFAMTVEAAGAAEAARVTRGVVRDACGNWLQLDATLELAQAGRAKCPR
jgi:hypothetical protein